MKADTKGHILYDFIDMKCPEWANSQRQKVDWQLSGAERNEDCLLMSIGFLFQANETALKLDSGDNCKTL